VAGAYARDRTERGVEQGLALLSWLFLSVFDIRQAPTRMALPWLESGSPELATLSFSMFSTGWNSGWKCDRRKYSNSSCLDRSK